MPTRSSDYMGLAVCAIAAAAPLTYFFIADDGASQRWAALAVGVLFGMPALLGMVGMMIGSQRMERARSWLSPLLLGGWFLTFGGILLFGGLFQADRFVGGLPFLPTDVNKSLGGGVFVMVGAFIALIGIMAVWSGIRNLLRRQ